MVDAAALLRRPSRPSSLVAANLAVTRCAPATHPRALDQLTRPFFQISRRWASTDQGQASLSQAASDHGNLQDGDSVGRLVQVQTSHDDPCIYLAFEGGWAKKPVPALRLWLRDLCQCPHCVSESSGQKRFSTCDIDPHPKVDSCSVRTDGSLEVVWAEDFLSGRAEAHTSIYSPDHLRDMVSEHLDLPRGQWRVRSLWDRDTFYQGSDARTVNYDDWIKGGPVFATALLDLAQWGLVIVKGVPESKDALQAIANKIGPLQNTFYGPTWDVISKPNAENVAYTNEFLCLHQDLMYWHDPPQIQLLHCLKNDCEGGDSLFSDGLRAAAELKLTNLSQYKSLEKIPVQFQYARNGHSYRRERPIFSRDTRGRFLPRHIQWSPPFQGPFFVGHHPHDNDCRRVREWHSGIRALRDSMEAPKNMLQFRMQPGECVVFDNQRIVHGRTQFDTTAGERHLHGTYLSSQTMKRALRRVLRDGASTSQEATLTEEKQAHQMYGVDGSTTK